MQKTISFLLFSFFASNAMADGLIGGNSIRPDDRVRIALNEKSLKYNVDSDGDYRLIIQLENKRTQLVIIQSRTSVYGNFEVRDVYSIAYKSSANQFPIFVANKLLEENSIKKIGAWEKNNQFAMFTVKLSANSDSESLLNAINVVADVSDTQEKSFSGSSDLY